MLNLGSNIWTCELQSVEWISMFNIIQGQKNKDLGRIVFDLQNDRVSETSYRQREKYLSAFFVIYMVAITCILVVFPSLYQIFE